MAQKTDETRAKRLAVKAKHRAKFRVELAAKQRVRYHAKREENLVKMAAYRAKNKEKLSAWFKAYKRPPSYDVQRSAKWHRRLANEYGLTLEQYIALGPLCWICGDEERTITKTGKVMKLTVDHNHETGTVRGLLCRTCNVGLGQFRDDVRLLMKAIAYLRNSMSQADTG